MTINFMSLVFIWLLPFSASIAVTSGQNHNFTAMVTEELQGNGFTQHQLMTQEASSLNPLSDILDHETIIVVDVNSTEEKTTNPSTKPSLEITQTPSRTFLPNIQTEATPRFPILSKLNSSTVSMKSTTEQFKVTTSATSVVNSPASDPTTKSEITRSSTQSRDAGKTSQFTSGKVTHPSTHPTQSTNFISTTNTSTKPGENKSTSASPVSGSDAIPTTGIYKTSPTTAKMPFIHITEAKKGQDPPIEQSKNGTNQGKVVAGLISGALILMMVGFLVIYIKKRKLLKQQITTTDWAGPSPFLEGGADNGQVTLRSSNQISLSSFLPQRLSKRLSLLPETDEELEDMTPGTTFGNKNGEVTFAQEVDDGNAQGSNTTVPEKRSTADVTETVENSLSVTSSQKNDPQITTQSK